MKILVIDDNKSITSSMDKYLKIKGFTPKVCNNGRDGLALIQDEKWDVIFLDLAMPECSGLNIIETLERDNLLKSQNIVLFTASSLPEYMILNLTNKEGVKTCLKKPISLVKIVETITA